jgi:uncharacterized protein (TIGR02466 family)
MQTIELFKQILVKINLNENLKQINNFSIKLKKKQKGRILSKEGGFQSDNLNKKEIVLNSLINKIEYYSNIFITDILKVNYKLTLDNIWININQFKDFNIIHNHPFSKISGVFYVKAPKNSGNLTFVNDSNIINFISDQNILNYNNYNSSIWSIEPEENVLYLFPSWFKHYVKPNLSNKKRISISFNLN